MSLAVAPGSQASFVASGADPAGDAADPSPGRDITNVGLTYDRRSGEIRAGVRLRGAPTASDSANLTIFAGRRSATGCDAYPAIGFATLTTITDADSVRLNSANDPDPTVLWARKTGGGTPVQEFEAKGKSFTGQRPNCVIATISAPENVAQVYDTAGPFTLKGVPGLLAQIGKAPATMTPGRARKIRVTLRNPGDAPTGRIRLAVKKARGLQARFTRTVKSIPAGKRRTVTLKVTLSKRAKLPTTLRVTATAPHKIQSRDDVRLYVRQSSKTNKGGGSGSGSGSSGPNLCYRYTWLPPYGMLVPC